MPHSSSDNVATSYKHALEFGREHLNAISENPQSEALLLLQHATGKSKEHLIAHHEDALNPQALHDYHQFIQRRQSGEPMAYIKKEKEFWSLPLSVNHHVLIPRPETELLVDTALSILAENPHANILDLGTGSGCIALALAKELPNAKIVASDVSQSCIDTATQNANNLQVSNIQFITSDWFENIPHMAFDLIVSNPPYISTNDKDIEPHVRDFEPSSALFADNNGLQCLIHIIEHARHYLAKQGSILLEHGHQQATDVQHYLTQNDFDQVASYQDMQQYLRATSGQYYS